MRRHHGHQQECGVPDGSSDRPSSHGRSVERRQHRWSLRLVDVFWASTCVVGRVSADWDLFDADGEPVDDDDQLQVSPLSFSKISYLCKHARPLSQNPHTKLGHRVRIISNTPPQPSSPTILVKICTRLIKFKSLISDNLSTVATFKTLFLGCFEALHHLND